MEERTTATLEKIQEAALAEFLDKGFQGASLRQIVKNAGVTTGAFYGYFSSKEALFKALVEPHATALMGKFMKAQISFAELPEEQQLEHTGMESGTYPDWMGQHREDVIWMDLPLGHLRCTQKGPPSLTARAAHFTLTFRTLPFQALGVLWEFVLVPGWGKLSPRPCCMMSSATPSSGLWSAGAVRRSGPCSG